MIKPPDDNIEEVPNKRATSILKKLGLKEHPKTPKEFEARRKQYGIGLGRIE